jgi:hypothetical protein
MRERDWRQLLNTRRNAEQAVEQVQVARSRQAFERMWPR